MTAQELYTDTVRFLDKQEQARLAALILNAMEQTDIPLDRSDQFLSLRRMERQRGKTATSEVSIVANRFSSARPRAVGSRASST